MTDQGITAKTPLLLIHPVGVGLSAKFWNRFINRWKETGDERDLIAQDVSCGAQFPGETAASQEARCAEAASVAVDRKVDGDQIHRTEFCQKILGENVIGYLNAQAPLARRQCIALFAESLE